MSENGAYFGCAALEDFNSCQSRTLFESVNAMNELNDYMTTVGVYIGFQAAIDAKIQYM
jgi:hypothetical protein